jgi:hypothetical protein
MSINTWPPAGDDQDIIAQTAALDKQRQQMSTGVDSNVAARIGEIYRANPWMQPGQILALAKAGASDKLVSEASKLAGANAPKYTETPRKKNWFERNVYDPLKASARYTFATLNLAPELAQNVASQVLNKDNPAGFDGWFKSTSLGTMIAASKGEIDPVTGQQISAGDGFFLGGTAYEKQSERARAVRGTINGSAWTLGRGAAAVAFAPGTKPYNILSGFVDAAVNVFADPTLYAGKALKGVRTARAAVPSLQTAEEISAFQKVAAAGGELAAAGLDQAETIAWNGSKFRNWATTNGKARYLTNVLVDNDNAYDIFENVFKGNIDLPIANRLAKAKSADEVLAIVGEAANRMDTELSGLFPTDIREIVKLRDRVPLLNNLRKSRLLTTMPDAVITAGSSRDNMKAVQSYGRYLRTLGDDLDPETFDNFMSKAMDIYGNPNGASVAELNSLFETVVKETVGKSLTRGGRLSGLDAADVDSVTSKIFESVRGLQDNLRIYMMNEAGEIDDFGALQALIDAGRITLPENFNPAQMGRLRMAGPGSLVELADKTYVLPDVRTVRRLTSNPFIRRAVSKKSGDQRGLIAAADYLQNEIWKPLTLATGGYIFRNMFDAQIRIGAVGLKGFFNHPIDYIMMVSGKAMPESLVGRIGLDDLDELEATGRMTRAQTEFAEAMGMGMRRHVDDPVQAMRRGFRTGVIQRVNINDPDKAGYLDALYDDIRRQAQDQLGNWVGKNATSDEIVDWLRNNPDGATSLRKIETYLKNGIEAYDPVSRKMGYAKITNGEIDDDILKWWVERLNSPRIQQLGGQDDTIRFAMSYRRMPLAASETIDSSTLRDADFVDGSLKRGKGSIVRLPGTDVEAIVTDTNNGRNWTVRQMSEFDVFDDEEGITMFKEYLRNVAETNPSILPTWTKRVGASAGSVTPGMAKKDAAVIDLKNRAVDAFFSGAYGRISKKFERSPVFRQFYYSQIVDNADLLTREQADVFGDWLTRQAAALDTTPEAVVGGKKQYAALQKKLASANGTGTIKQLQEYSQLRALQSTKETLFNAVERNNLQDILRIIVPFGPAWSEVMSSYAQFLIEDPRLIRRAQQVFTGAANYDPDGDGQGFFFKDPVTGENSFYIPFSGELSKLITGVNAPMQANVKGLSMGLQVFPAVGPVVQIAASQVIPDTPATDTLVEFLLPYGRKGADSLTPGWVRKLYSAVEGNPGKLESIYSNTYVETVRALSASGEYDLDMPAEKEQLLEDAKGKARVLTFFRAMSQFLGPTAASPEFIVPTNEGDIMSSALISAFNKLQTENYDTAVSEFLRIYGEDALLYVSSKSRSTVPGIEATDQFGDWERRNSALLQSYPKAAAYFAPGGDDFSFSTWERQIRTGARERLSAPEIIELAQYRIGSALYRDLKRQAGQYPNQEVRDWLARQRQAIHEQYPGFPAQAVFTIGEYQQTLEQLRNVANDQRMQGNDVASAVREYLKFRDQAVAQYVAAGGRESGFAQAKGTLELRQWLFNIGTGLADAYPDFQRVWERELSSEVD